MDREEALKLLRGGPAGIAEWNRRRREGERIPSLEEAHLNKADLSKADLHEADFRGACFPQTDLSRADLREANLSGANLFLADLREAKLVNAIFSEADLRGANLLLADLREAKLVNAILGEANLSQANLSGADLRNAIFSEANLTGAKLSGADLNWATLSGANLSEASLHRANLQKANLSRVNLSEANLADADLNHADLVECTLSAAVVDNACVWRINIQELQGLPKPPNTLRTGVCGDTKLTGHEAETFFKMPAIVEVYLTETLSQKEWACFNLHLAELQGSSIATELMVGHRAEIEGSVLRFQGPNYDYIYSILGDLVEPFRMARAVAWKQTVNKIPSEQRGEAIMALAKLEARSGAGKWRFAEQMAAFFRTYATAKVYQISEGRRKGVRIDVYTDQELADRLSRIALPANIDDKESLLIRTGEQPTIQRADTVQITNIKAGGNLVGAFGRGASFTARDITVYKQTIENSQVLDSGLKEKLIEAREAVEKLKLPQAEKEDVADQLGNLTTEMQKGKPKARLVARFWNRIKEIAPTVAAILQTAETIAKYLP
ncbi:MAG: pentapeptide repeat-containing protein [Planctomycetota bacterium]